MTTIPPTLSPELLAPVAREFRAANGAFLARYPGGIDCCQPVHVRV